MENENQSGHRLMPVNGNGHIAANNIEKPGTGTVPFGSAQGAGSRPLGETATGLKEAPPFTPGPPDGSDSAGQPFAFLNTEAAKKYFADADFALKSGRHIQNYSDEYKIWDFINEYHDKGLSWYYEFLYGVRLMKDTNDREVYFYLDFIDDNKGKFNYDRNQPIEDKHVIFGILLLNMYKEKFFEAKEMKWEELEYIIEDSEQKDLWQKLLYGEVKRNYTPNEKVEVKKKIRRTLNYFEKLGFVRWMDPEMIHFEILPAIDRLAKLYSREIAHVEVISDYLSDDTSGKSLILNP